MLDRQTIIRAWKDKTFREGLSETDRQALPDHPSGWIELSSEQMLDVTGGIFYTSGCITSGYTCSPKIVATTLMAGCGGGSGTQTTCHISRPV